MNLINLCYASAAMGMCLIPTAVGFVVKVSSAPVDLAPLTMIAKGQQDEPLSTRTRYKNDINALDQLLDAQEEEKLEEIRALVQDIQETRKNNPEVALSHRVREALADYHSAEAKYGPHSREAKVAHEYFVDICNAENMKPEHLYAKDAHSTELLKEALEAVNVLEELKEIAHMEKSILDRFGTTDFEIGEGFLERGIGREDPGYDLWP